MIRSVLLLVILGTMVSACTSPEATRTRGEGRGADVGNRGRVVKMHQGSSPYYKTPDRIPGLQQMPLEAADQAERLSRE